MKEWKDVPEYKKAWDEFMTKGLELDQTYWQRKIPNCEFDFELYEFDKKNWEKIRKIQDEYRKLHPEEFDENGNFKVDA